MQVLLICETSSRLCPLGLEHCLSLRSCADLQVPDIQPQANGAWGQRLEPEVKHVSCLGAGPCHPASSQLQALGLEVTVHDLNEFL